MNCRHCNNIIREKVIDLGYAPPSNAYLIEKKLYEPEVYYPLRVMVCIECWLVQTQDFTTNNDVFQDDYAYYSSTSSSWLNHAKKYVDMIIQKLSLAKNSLVIEIASNDGYLLQFFKKYSIPCIGVEPTKGTAEKAREKGIHVIQEFFSTHIANRLTSEGRLADLIIGNNVFAHVPDINDFTLGMKKILKNDGTITLEFPHLLNLLKNNQFDTIYHEHFSYLSLSVADKIFRHAGLKIYDVEELNTHGGSLRVYGCHYGDSRNVSSEVDRIIGDEIRFGLYKLDTYKQLQNNANRIKNDLINFLIEAKNSGKKVVAYGAAAKGTTLLNYSGIKADLLECVYDAAESKQGKYLPGCHIPIMSDKLLEDSSADYVLILPWNISAEVVSKNANSLKRDAAFLIAVPKLQIL